MVVLKIGCINSIWMQVLWGRIGLHVGGLRFVKALILLCMLCHTSKAKCSSRIAFTRQYTSHTLIVSLPLSLCCCQLNFVGIIHAYSWHFWFPHSNSKLLNPYICNCLCVNSVCVCVVDADATDVRNSIVDSVLFCYEQSKETNGTHALNRFHAFETHEESVTWLKS